MSRATPGIDSRTWNKILRRRGCEQLRTSGGHVIYRAPSGAMFPATAEGRKTMPTFKEIRTAANIFGCSIEEMIQR